MPAIFIKQEIISKSHTLKSQSQLMKFSREHGSPRVGCELTTPPLQFFFGDAALAARFLNIGPPKKNSMTAALQEGRRVIEVAVGGL